MRARTKRGRVCQIANYLYDVGFRPGYPVDIRFVKPANVPRGEKLFGWAEKSGRRGVICLVEASTSTIGLLIDSYLHELAHHLDGAWGNGKRRPHGPEWGTIYARLIHECYDTKPGGIVESFAYPDKWRS